MIRAILFDVDNTLYQTDRAFLETLITALGTLQEQGVVVPQVPMQRVQEVQKQNLPFEQIFIELFGDLSGQVLEMYRSIAPQVEYVPTPYAHEAMVYCRERGIVMGLVTNRVRMLDERLEQAGFIPDDFVCKSMPAEKQFAKPHPRAFESALEVLEETYGITSTEILVVGDHTDDYYAAKANGMSFMAVTQGTTQENDFVSAGVPRALVYEDVRGLDKAIEYVQKIRAYERSLHGVSAIDTRYALETSVLQPFVSEHAFHKYRVMVEIEHLIALSLYTHGEVVRTLLPEEIAGLRSLYTTFSLQNGFEILAYDHLGRRGIGPLEHDTKAVEVWIQEQFIGTTYQDLISKVHMFLTSEDVRNLAIKSMVRDAIETVVVKEVHAMTELLASFATEYADAPVMARTHMQPASPTTFGKIFGNYLVRYTRAMHRLRQVQLFAKVNGAVGNYNSFAVAYPHIDWQGYATYLTHTLGFFTEQWTDQRGPMRDMVMIFQALQEIGTITRDLAQDMSLYVSLGTMYVTKVESHVGSSVMPHKVNPWFAEVAEGAIKKAQAFITLLSTDLDVSRLQRDLSDHELERGYADILSYLLIGLTHARMGLSSLVPDVAYAREELQSHREVVTEAIQTILRKYDADDAYMQVKTFARGARITKESLDAFIDALEVKDDVKQEISRVLEPEAYVGYAATLARQAVTFYTDTHFTP